MDSMPIEHLEKIHSISAVKVLVSFFHKSKEVNSLTIEYSISELANDLSYSKNTVRSGLAELISLGIIVPIQITIGNKPNRYQINLSKQKEAIDGWSRVTAASREEEQKNEIVKMVNQIDFNNLEFLSEDINSSMVNNNVFMEVDEIKRLGNKLVREFFYYRVIPPTDKVALSKWIAIQSKVCTDLLVKYTTEQVCAGITYWVEIKGITRMNLMYLHNSKKMMEALDYYKRLYLETKAHDDARKKAEESLNNKQVQKENLEKEKIKIDNMSNEEFLQSFLGSLIGKKDES